jgi:hypothetical protein
LFFGQGAQALSPNQVFIVADEKQGRILTEKELVEKKKSGTFLS